jgi:hypothetical protein
MGIKRTKQGFQTTQTNANLILDLSHVIKKIKSKNRMCVQCECKKILLQKHDKSGIT